MSETTLSASIGHLLKRRKRLLGAAGSHGSVLKFHPPIVFTRDNMDLLLGRQDEVLRRVA